MREASIARVIVPRPMTLALVEAYQNAGRELDYALFPGQPHGFAHRPDPASDDCIRLMRAFIARRVSYRRNSR